MMVSDSRKAANVKWDSANLKCFSIKVTTDIADEFKRICLENGDTPYSVLRKAVDDYISEHK